MASLMASALMYHRRQLMAYVGVSVEEAAEMGKRQLA